MLVFLAFPREGGSGDGRVVDELTVFLFFGGGLIGYGCLKMGVDKVAEMNK